MVRLTSSQIAFDAALKANSDYLYPGIADLEAWRASEPSVAPLIDQLVTVRDAFNAALEVEGQNTIGDAPHQPFYFDYIDSTIRQGLAFADRSHSFIGITLPLAVETLLLANRLAHSQQATAAMRLPTTTDVEALHGILFWMLFGFVVSHEYAHHTHGHFAYWRSAAGARRGLMRQACETDADGWAVYLKLNHWLLADARPTIVEALALTELPVCEQDAIIVACFVAAHAAGTFAYEPRRVNPSTVSHDTHPLQPARLQIVSRHIVKFVREFKPELSGILTNAWYSHILDAVSQLMWNDASHGTLWRQQAAFLRTVDGIGYFEALLAELDRFREELRRWRHDGRGRSST